MLGKELLDALNALPLAELALPVIALSRAGSPGGPRAWAGTISPEPTRDWAVHGDPPTKLFIEL
jgi:hypothetical protein